ncbi:MAG: EamA family transporter [Clostridiaceae bacterium]
MNFYWPLILIVASNVFYNLCAKSMPQSVNPLASLGITYLVAAASTIFLYFLTSPVKNLATEYAGVNWAVFILGISIVGLEFGYIYLYKLGWSISIGSLVANIALAVILVFVGVLLYKETVSPQQLMGIGLCIAGLIFINK